MTTRKKIRSRKIIRSRRHKHKHTNKMLKKKDKKRYRHRRRSSTVSSWDKHYNYESDTNSEVGKMNKSDKDDVQAVHGLKDFLQGKVEKKGITLSALMS